MLRTFVNQEGFETTIKITDEGKVTYSVGKRKTTFALCDCDTFVYQFKTTGEKVQITEEMIDETEEIKSWLWLVILKGEERLLHNNEMTETRKHDHNLIPNIEGDISKLNRDALSQVIAMYEAEALKSAIRSLEPQQQQLIQDIYIKGLSLADISRRDGVNKSSVTKRMERILSQLRKKIKNF